MNVTFEKIGDFYECLTTDTEHARAVAALLGKTVSKTRTPGTVTVGVPYWQIDEAVRQLTEAGATVEVRTMKTLKYRDEWRGPEYHYRSKLRPVASIGYDQIPGILIEPGSDPDGTRRDFYTSEPLEKAFMDRWDIETIP